MQLSSLFTFTPYVVASRRSWKRRLCWHSWRLSCTVTVTLERSTIAGCLEVRRTNGTRCKVIRWFRAALFLWHKWFCFCCGFSEFLNPTATFKAGCENGRTSQPLSTTTSDSQLLIPPVEPRSWHAFHLQTSIACGEKKNLSWSLCYELLPWIARPHNHVLCKGSIHPQPPKSLDWEAAGRGGRVLNRDGVKKKNNSQREMALTAKYINK